MTQALCALCAGTAVALTVLDIGYTARGWSWGTTALAEYLPRRRSWLLKRLETSVERLRESSNDLAIWEEIAFSLACHIRAGETLAQALKAVADEGTEPPYRLLKRAFHEYEAGVPVLTALNAASQRSREFAHLSGVLELGLVNGGDLPALLCRCAEELRKQRTRRGEVRAKLVEARLTALLLTFLPWGIGFFTVRNDPRVGRALIGDPQGRLLFLVALGLWACGVFAVQRLISGVSRGSRR
ncbi:MAG TPA: hypothetical protein GXX23_08800 [Firmicutes bacterium]|mgnify:CR=1 FL=1|nr:hypothetical protein [Candidatus Fermentithermobacillaceae bacterium]